MKKFYLMLILAVSLLSFLSAKESSQEQEKDLYEYNNMIAKLHKVEEPKVLENYIVFTHKTEPRFVGIAFDFEKYNSIHPFKVHNNYDIDGNITSSVMFYTLERPKDITEFNYRLIIDGLWTADPVNPNKIYDSETGISLSKIYIGNKLPEITRNSDIKGTKFIYNGEPGLNVRLGGSFTNWDSWIYNLEETKPGFYELTLPLPQGKYYYNYYLGMNALLDKSNPNKAYTEEGKTVSVIEVN